MFLFCTPLKTPENLWFSRVFRGHKNGNISQKWDPTLRLPIKNLQNFYSKELTEPIFWLLNNQAINP